MASLITLNSYSVFCNTELSTVFTYGYQENPPTVCPHNNAHSIDVPSIAIVNTYTIGATYLEIDKSQTGGNLLTYCTTFLFPKCPSGTVQEAAVQSLPFIVRALTLTINPGPENFLDIINMYSAPHTIVGATTSIMNSGQNIMLVNGTVYTNIKIGYMVRITGGGNSEEFTFLVSKQTSAGPIYELTLSSNAINTYPIGSVVDISVPRIMNMRVLSSNPIVLGDKPPGTSLVTPNMPAMLRYTNNDGLPKEVNIIFDVFY